MRAALSLLLCTPVMAWSQETETIPVQTLPEPTTETRVESAPVQLEAVVVKGEKLGRKLSETTSSVSVYSGRNIEDQGDASLGDLLRRAANTTANEEGNISIRGVSQQGAGGPSGSPLISVQVDGVTLDRTSQQGAGDELFDVDQVEVLRGAQSTSQGRNALAGAVVINTREPTREWDLRTRAVRSQRDGREYSLAGGGPLSEAFAFRVVGTFENDDGFITHEPDGNRDFARSQKSLLRGKLAFAPEGGRFDSLLMVTANRSNGQPDYNQESGEAGSDRAQRRTSTVSVYTDDLTRGGAASWRNRLRLGEHYTVTALTSHMRTQQDYQRDFDGLAEDGGENIISSHGYNVSQELRLNLKDVGPFTGVIGVYGGRFRDDNVFFSNNVFVSTNQAVTLFTAPCTDTPLGCITPSVPIAGDLAGVSLDFASQANRDARNIAGFTEFDIKLPWRLTATLGLRYDRESLSSANRADTSRGDLIVRTPQGLQAVPLAADVLAGVVALQPGLDVLPVLLGAGVAPNTNGEQRGRTRYSALLPKGGLRWAVTPQWSLFATYAEAYRAGGVDVDSQTGESLPYKPEYTRNYEVGARGDYAVFDVAANVFYTDWRDQQVPVLRGQFFVTQNAARSRLYGAETSIGWRVVKPLRLQLALGTTHTEFLDYQVPGADYSGNSFIFAPRFTGSLGAVWRPLGSFRGVMVAANVSRRTMAFTSPQNVQSERSEGRTLLDGRVGYERGNYRAYLFGRNLLNEDVVTESYQFPNGYIGAPTARGYAAYSAPRTLGVQVEARF